MKINCQNLNNLKGLQFIPVDENKKPIPTGWQTTIKKYDLSQVEGVGLVCGIPSGNLEAIDFDLKYDLNGTLYEKYKQLVNLADKSLLPKMVVQKTRSSGFHFLYRCETIGGNTKLASRRTTEMERAYTYKATYEAEIVKDGVDDEIAKKRAEKASTGDKKRALIETRGLGGQILVSPSAGYDFIFGDLISISQITPEEREVLIGIARSFNEYYEEITVPKNQAPKVRVDGTSPFEDYNERGDIVGLLESNGWKVVGNKGNKTLFLRPGQTTSQSSGNYDHNKKWFSVFSTSTEFEPEHAYQPYAVFAVLECNKNFSEASKKLYELGYGDRYVEPKEKEKAPSTRVIPSRVNVEDNDYDFLAKPEDYDSYLQQVIDGTLKMGLTTGCPSLDAHFLFKEGNLVITNGIDNAGKSVFTWWLLLIAAMYHGWKGIIFSSENTLGSFMRKMIQFYWGKQLYGTYAMKPSEYKIAKEFIEKHFILIKAQEDLFNYKDLINMVKKSKKKYPDFNYAMIDPYNSLKIDLSGYSKLNTHEYHYEALSEIKAYGQKNNLGWYLTMHAYTGAARAKDGEKKYALAPKKEDTEGGSKFGNKADDFLTVHRLTSHPTDWMVTELHVRKIKETDTGGRPTSLDSPIRFEMYKGGTGFIERFDEGNYGVDPISKWHSKNGIQQEILLPIIEEPKIVNMWTPFKNDNEEEITF